MKVLVLQVNIGSGAYTYGNTIRSKFDYNGMFQESCIPTVKRWAEKHSYDYKEVNEMPEELSKMDFSWYCSAENKKKECTFVRYYEMAQEKYDLIVSLDTDIFIPKNAEPIPVSEGYYGVSSSKVPKPGINGGVQVIDKHTGQRLSLYVRDKMNKKRRPSVMPKSDQGYVYAFRKKYKISQELDESWNYMVSDEEKFPIGSDYPKGINIIHYGGTKGRNQFIKDYENGVLEQ